ncbi:MAG: spore germination protein [Bacillota bacterium]|nr:spore germination protein [Bacillota bacterium]
MRFLQRTLLFKEPEEPSGRFESGGEDRQSSRTPPSQDNGNEDALTGKGRQHLAEAERLNSIIRERARLSDSLDANKEVLKNLFRAEVNNDAILREFSINTDPPVRAMIIFYDGLVSTVVQDQFILQPLMLLAGLRPAPEQPRKGPEKPSFKIHHRRPGAEDGDRGGKKDKEEEKDREVAAAPPIFRQVLETLLPGNQVAPAATFADVVAGVMNADTALLIDGCAQALLIETKNWAHRSVSPPRIEAVIRGPQESFVEHIRTNTTLVRKILRDPALVTEFVKIGKMSTAQAAVMYMDSIANPEIVTEVKRRLQSVRSDLVSESGLIEQLIEDAPYGLAPQVLATERPDRVAAALVEGQVAVLPDGNPFALIVPATFFSLFQAAEDAYVRFPFGTMLRLIRFLGFLVALLLPGVYVAITTFHPEFIPTDLMLAMTGARERVPFPTVVELLLLEVSFELIREAGIRIPGTVGTTLGIVGALILGQAAVAANIVSPILIVVVAVTALGSFAIPNYGLGLSIRALRFAYILLGSILGLFGIVVGLFIHVALLANMRSFGVPYLAPLAPVTASSPDYFWRGPAWEQESRPDYLDPLRRERQPRVSRGWLIRDRRKPRGGPEGGGDRRG